MSDTSYIDILNNAVNRAGPHASLTMGGSVVPAGFCTAWPLVKGLVGALAGAAAWIPNYGALVSSVLTGLIQIADDVYSKECVVPPSGAKAP